MPITVFISVSAHGQHIKMMWKWKYEFIRDLEWDHLTRDWYESLAYWEKYSKFALETTYCHLFFAHFNSSTLHYKPGQKESNAW